MERFEKKKEVLEWFQMVLYYYSNYYTEILDSGSRTM